MQDLKLNGVRFDRGCQYEGVFYSCSHYSVHSVLPATVNPTLVLMLWRVDRSVLLSIRSESYLPVKVLCTAYSPLAMQLLFLFQMEPNASTFKRICEELLAAWVLRRSAISFRQSVSLIVKYGLSIWSRQIFCYVLSSFFCQIVLAKHADGPKLCASLLSTGYFKSILARFARQFCLTPCNNSARWQLFASGVKMQTVRLDYPSSVVCQCLHVLPDWECLRNHCLLIIHHYPYSYPSVSNNFYRKCLQCPFTE